MTLSQTLQSLQAYADTLGYGITINDLNGNYVYVNTSFCGICEYSADELLQMGFKDLTHKDDVQANVTLDQQLKEGHIPFFQMAKRYLTKSGSIKNVLLQVSLIRDGDNNPVYYYAQVIDVTDLSNVLEQDLQSDGNTQTTPLPTQQQHTLDSYRILDLYREKNLNKARHLGYIVHELKTPLNSVKGMGSLMFDRFKKGQTEQADFLYHRFVQSCDQLNHLINDILEMTYIDTGNLKLDKSDVNIVPLVLTVIQSLEQTSQLYEVPIRFSYQCPIDSMVYSDEEKLRAIVTNLISNGLKYTEQGQVDVTLTLEGTDLTIKVRDTGIGIREADLNRVFDEYHKVHSGLNKTVDSTGLGLSITRRLVQSLGGEIHLESTFGVGSTFTVTIPV